MLVKKIKVNDMIFYVGFILFIICNFLRNTEIEIFKDLLWFISIFMLGLNCFTQKYEKKELLRLVILVGIFVIVSVASKSYFLLGVPIALISAKNKPLKRIIFIILCVNIIMTIITILSSIFLGVGDISQTRIFRSDMEVITRYYFGFVHPNQLSVTIFSILSCLVVLYWDKLNLTFLVISTLIIYITNYFTDSNTSLYTSIMLIILSYVFKFIEKKNIKIDYKIFMIAVLVVCFIAIACMVFYGKHPIIDTIDEALSSRIHAAYEYWRLNGISLFGKNIFTHRDTTFDQGITNTFLRYGIILFLCMLYGIYKSLKTIEIKKPYSYKYQLILVIFVFYSFFENEIYDIYRNIGIYIGFSFLLQSLKEKEKRNDIK